MTSQQPKPARSRVRVVEDLTGIDEPAVGAYIRVTSEESVKADLSIPNQKRRAIEVCAERGWPLAKLYVEPRHIGGELGPEQRPALRALLDDIAADRVGRVLVRHTDRLWRSTRVQDRILAAFSDHGVELWDFSAQHEYRSAHGRFSTVVLGAVAELEKNLVGERVREMKRGKAIAGKPAGGPPPYGYISQARFRVEQLAQGVAADVAEEQAAKHYPISKRWYLDEREAAVVRRIFALYTEAHVGTRRIADLLSADGCRTRTGRLWWPARVVRILQNPAVAGFVTYDEDAYRARRAKKAPTWRQTYYDGEHDAIIPRPQWEDACRLRERNRTLLRTKSTAGHVYPLAGILKCGACGSHLVGKASGPGRPRYYLCAARKYRGATFGCAAPALPARASEDTVLADVECILSAPEFVHEFMAKANERLRQQRPEAARRLAAAEEHLRAAERAVERYQRRYEGAPDGESEEIAWTKLREAMARKKEGEAQVAAARAEAESRPAPTITVEQTARYLAALREHLGAQPDRQRALLGLLQARHDLRVRALDGSRLVLTLRLDDAAVAAAGVEPLRNRLVVVPGGAQPAATSAYHVLTRELTLPAPVTAKAWAAAQNASGRHRCACGCGEALRVLPRHRAPSKGVPRFVQGHSRMDMTDFVADLNRRGYLTITQAAAKLGIGETTLRRKDRALGLKPRWVRWGKRRPMRAYREAALLAPASRTG